MCHSTSFSDNVKAQLFTTISCTFFMVMFLIWTAILCYFLIHSYISGSSREENLSFVRIYLLQRFLEWVPVRVLLDRGRGRWRDGKEMDTVWNNAKCLSRIKWFRQKRNLSNEFSRSFNRLMLHEYLHVVREEYFHISVVIRWEDRGGFRDYRKKLALVCFKRGIW